MSVLHKILTNRNLLPDALILSARIPSAGAITRFEIEAVCSQNADFALEIKIGANRRNLVFAGNANQIITHTVTAFAEVAAFSELQITARNVRSGKTLKSFSVFIEVN